MATGRPTAYSEEIAQRIIMRMADGESLRSICASDDMPARSTVMLWAATDREGFSDRYAKACEARAHYWADELLDIADDSQNDYMEREGVPTLNGEALQRSRLRVDTRKWLLSKMLPRYADRQVIDNTSSDGSMTPDQTGAAVNRLASMVEAIAERTQPKDAEPS